MKNIKQNDVVTGCLCALGCETLYGLSYMFTKQATDLASTFALLGWRFFIAVVVMSIFIFCGIVKIDLKGKDIKLPFMVALFCPCLYFIAETVGISHTTASETGVFLACIPVAALVASTVILKKRPTGFQITGILITLCGVVVTVAAVGASTSLSITGYIALLAGVVLYALYTVFVDKASEFTGAELTYIMLASGAVLFMILALAEAMINGNVSQLISLPFRESTFLIAVLYQGIGCSVAAFFLSNVAIAKIGVNRTSSFIGVSTVVSVIAGAVILKETFSLNQIIGAVVIIIGVYTANIKQNSK